MENYVKAVLYVYPRLERIGRDYEEHIRNRAFMSYDYRVTTEKLSEYLAEEIIRKELIENLKETMDGILTKLTEGERFLLELRYFKRKSRLKKYCSAAAGISGSLRSYYRRQTKALQKVEFLMKGAGMTREKFFRDYARFDGLMSVYRYIEEGREKAAAPRERALVCFLADRAASRSVDVWLKKGRKKQS